MMEKSEEKEVQTDEQEEKPVYERAYVCPRCGYGNPPRAGFCFVCGEPLITEMKKIPGYELEWTHEMDEHLRKQFQKASLEDLKRGLDRRFGLSIPEMMILRRAEALGLVGRELESLEDEQKPEYLKSNIVWMQGAETARVRGDVSIPENDIVPFNIIVEGGLISQSDVVFQGGLHVKGSAVLGDRNSVMKSIICEEMVVLGRNTVVENLVDSDGPVFVRRGVIVGTGERGGIASGDTVYVELGFSGKTKIYASKGVKVVKNIHEILPEGLKQIIGRERELVTPIPSVVSVKPPEVRPIEAISTERELVTPIPHPEVQASKVVEEEKPEITKIKLPKPVVVVREYETMDETDALFKSLEDRIREFNNAKKISIEGIGLEELREDAEVEVFKLAASGCDVNEIGLRLLMGPFEVQETLNALIEKGYLDENLKPKRRETREKPEVSAPETVQEAPTEEETEEEGVASEEKPSKEEPEKEAETEMEEPSRGDQKALDTERFLAVKLRETKSVLKKFGKAFSSLWKRSEKEENNNADSLDSSDDDSSSSEDAIKELTEL